MLHTYICDTLLWICFYQKILICIIVMCIAHVMCCCLQWTCPRPRDVVALHCRCIHAAHMGEIRTELNDHYHLEIHHQKIARFCKHSWLKWAARCQSCGWCEFLAIQYCMNVGTSEKIDDGEWFIDWITLETVPFYNNIFLRAEVCCY